MISRAAWLSFLLACGAPEAKPTSVTITSPSARPQPTTSCPLQPNALFGAACRDLGAVCRYPDLACVCRSVPYCPGGAFREGPPPPDHTVEFECIHPDCVSAVEGGACAHEGLACRASPCYSRLTCTAGRWKLVQLGPPP